MNAMFWRRLAYMHEEERGTEQAGRQVRNKTEKEHWQACSGGPAVYPGRPGGMQCMVAGVANRNTFHCPAQFSFFFSSF